MERDIDRKGILIDLLDWLHKEFKDDLPSLVRMPIHLALAIAHKASPEKRDQLKTATKADIREAIEHSKLAGQYAAAGAQKFQAIEDAVRFLHKAFTDGIESLHALVSDIKADTTAIRRAFRTQARLDQPFTLTPPRNLPSRNPKFVGRTKELEDIHKLLSRETLVGVTQEAATHGFGGIGKTSIAQEYAWSHLDDYPGGVFVISCDTDLLLPAVVELATPLGIEEADTPEKTADQVRTRLERAHPALLILDNVRSREQWADAEWKKCLPGRGCRRLITTRTSVLPGIEMYLIERLPRDQGIALLSQHRADAGDPENEKIVGDVVEWFDGLAVGLTVVGFYMSMHPDVSWEKYGESLKKKGLGTVRATERETGALPDYDKRIDTVFDDTLDALPPDQRRPLEYAALLPEDTVVRGWLKWLLEHDESIEVDDLPGYEGDRAEHTLLALITPQLLRPSKEGDHILSLHRVLRRRLNELLDDDAKHKDALLDRIAHLAVERGKASHDALTNKSIRWELTPLLALSEAQRGHGRLNDAANLANWVHTPLKQLGRYIEDRASLDRFVEDDRGALKLLDHREASALLSNLGLTLKDLGQLAEARRRMEQAIEIEERHFKPDHPMLAISYSNLAGILKDLGDLPEARRRMEQAIQIGEKHFDPDHPKLAIRYSNLATILQDLGDLPEARRRMEQAIEIEEKHFDPDHPTLAISYSNLAMILRRLGDLPEARRRIEQAIEIEEQHFEPDHPTLAISYNNLAHIELADGNKVEACELWRRSYAIFTEHFDEDHHHVRSVAEALRKVCGGVPKPGGGARDKGG